MGNKGYVTIYIDKQVVQKAKELGFNISKLCENCLKEAIKRMERPIIETDGGPDFLGKASFGKEGLAGPRGFEPPFSGSEGRRLHPDWATDPE